MSEAGTLWVVATPIGNLDDLSPRAKSLLESVPVIAAEDTRVSSRLLGGRAERAEMVSLHEYNEARVVDRLIERLASGTDIALVSDAGTPLISDPGYRLVSAAHEAGVPVRTVPGPCAATAALSIAGLATDRFWFEGFLPAKPGARRKRLQALSGQTASLVFYTPARDLPDVLRDMITVFGPKRRATLARELTKLHETVRRDELEPLHDWLVADTDQQRGEAVLVVAGSEDAQPVIDPAVLAEELARELPPSRAAKVLARLTGLNRQEAFALIEARRK
ncbi:MULTISPECIES: 16S rRNA (cytidine(1402)-2'-O)-methyltransferase [unclassified Wenzhouxiangella]|uniref:16S rRNA (cytidine(1402)-2'-O)-methyltransferase n=1 Tax=unclassified Wenzhouxiangella TaxID=2613841 RepID=UPI000E329EB6|nr:MULTISPECIES: 16S rRNA (cytidine(1402)-2'-O)-methyltransferase [unclassified Wenzhouxiangella]RFF27667.1 16S rRNA (cytidine(1402)-2'-O)-methyltransferase [Wenzhouxiangella sp. 15181]RFP69759.1 16S rRNA (cytidine(1402)-2'-O)-methyltransferase [Wenzhouxiangella sp. 15190]